MSVAQENIATHAFPRWRRSSITHAVLRIAMCISDILIIIAVSFATGLLYHYLGHNEVGNINHYLSVGFLAVVTFIIPTAYRQEYTLERQQSLPGISKLVIQNWTISFFIIFILGFLTKSTAIYSRGWLLFFYFSGIVILTLGKFGLSQLINFAISKGVVTIQRVILVGEPEYIEKFLLELKNGESKIEILNTFFLPPNRAIDAILDDVLKSSRILAPDSVYIAVPLENKAQIEKCVEKLTALPLSLHLVSDGILSRFRRIEVTRIGGFISLGVLHPPLSILSLMIKRGLDFIGAAVLLLALAPIMIATAIAIRVDSSGPIFFTQRRFGFTQQPFQIFKFRTMNVREDDDKVKQVQKNDTRITRVGRFLRRTNLDELPQLLNVVLGQMSLIGPRPHAMIHDFEFERRIAAYAYRQKVKPGITGWAQVNGWRGSTDTERKLSARIEHDIFYIENWSLLLDLEILFLTVFSKKAYRNAE